MNQGFFVVFEGADGAGKTSTIDAIRQKIMHDFPGLKTEITSELDHTVVGKICHECLVNDRVDPLTRAYLFAAARSENVHCIIKPKLENGCVVFADRFLDSSLIYQGLLENIGINKIKEINKYAVGDIEPQVVFILNASVEKTIKNIEKRGGNISNFDRADLIVKKQISEYYIKLSKKDRRYILVDSDKDFNNVVEDVWKKLKPLIVKHYKLK